MKFTPLLLAPVVALLASAHSSAATIQYVGSELSSSTSGDWGTNNADFRSTGSSSKAYVTGSVNAYGTDGDIFPTLGSLPPTYVSGYSVGSGTYSASGAGFLSVDNPTAAIAPTVANVDNGIVFVTSGNALTFTLSENKSFRLGIVVGYQSPISLTVTDGAATLSESTGVDGNSGNYAPNWFFFDVTGNSGDTIAISGLADPSTYGQRYGFEGVTFDSVVVPEPNPAILFAIGLGFAFFVRRVVKTGRQS